MDFRGFIFLLFTIFFHHNVDIVCQYMRCPQKSQVFSGDTNGITKIHCNNNKNVNVLFPQGSDMKNTKIKSKIEYTIITC